MGTTKEYIQNGWEPVSDYVIDLMDKSKYDFIKDDNGISYCRNKQENVTESKQKRLKILEQTYTQIPKGWTPIPEDKVELYKKEGYEVKLFGDLGYAAKERDPKKEWYVLLPGETGGNRTHKDPLTREELTDIIKQQPNPGQVLVWRLGDPDEWRTAGSYGIAASDPKQEEKKATFEEQYSQMPCIQKFEIVENIKFPGYPVQNYYRAQVTLENSNKTTYAYFTNKPVGTLPNNFVAILYPDLGYGTRATYGCSDQDGGNGEVIIKGVTGENYKVKSLGYTKEDLVRKLSIVKNDNKSFGLPLYAIEGDDTLDTDVITNATEVMIGKINDNYRGNAFRRFGSLLNHLKNYYDSTGDSDTSALLKDLIDRYNGAVKNINQYNNIPQQNQVQNESKQKAAFDDRYMTEHKAWLRKISGEEVIEEQGLESLMKSRGLTPKQEKQYAPQTVDTPSYGSAAKTGMMGNYDVLTDPVKNEQSSYTREEFTQDPFVQSFVLWKYETISGGDYSLNDLQAWVDKESWSEEDCDRGLDILYSAASGRGQDGKIVSGLGGNDTRIRMLKWQVCRCREAQHYKKKDDISRLNYLGNLNSNPKYQIDCSEDRPENQPRRAQ